ncbi:Nucleoporin nup57 [Tritrichomonas musculus]|uniref:Nucleoporin nup57 n=1 Tax=Tritrichomonas musculus TaxID=1915356 RepID=A0ABR2K3C5_9EUKA
MNFGQNTFGQNKTGTTGFGTNTNTGFGTNTNTGFGTNTNTGFGQNKTGTTGFTTGTTTGFGTNTNTGFGFGQNKSTGFGTGFNWGSSFNTAKTQHVAILTPDPLYNKICNIRSAYNPESEAYRFCYIFYNSRKTQPAPTCPPNISEEDWQTINVECPDPLHLAPCPLRGFDALKKRSQYQDKMKEKLQERVELIQNKLREMTSYYATELQGLFEQIHQNEITIEQTMLEVFESEEVKRNQGKPITELESKMLTNLESMQSDLSKPGMFHAAIRNLRARTLEKANRVGVHLNIDKESLAALSIALKNNQDAIEALEKVTKIVARNVANLEAEMSDH